MNFSVIVEKDNLDGGYFAYVPQLKGCFTQAKTLDELRENILEAIAVSLEDSNSDIKNSSVIDIWNMEINTQYASITSN